MNRGSWKSLQSDVWPEGSADRIARDPEKRRRANANDPGTALCVGSKGTLGTGHPGERNDSLPEPSILPLLRNPPPDGKSRNRVRDFLIDS